jgi:hypothetical protein
MVAPTAAAGLAATLVLYLTHRRALPARLALPDIPPASVLVDPLGAALGTVNLAACLALLAAAPTLKFPMWAVTLACAGAAMAYNAVAYAGLRWLRRQRLKGKGHTKSTAALLPRADAGATSSQHWAAGGGAVGAGSPKHGGAAEPAAGSSAGEGAAALVAWPAPEEEGEGPWRRGERHGAPPRAGAPPQQHQPGHRPPASLELAVPDPGSGASAAATASSSLAPPDTARPPPVRCGGGDAEAPEAAALPSPAVAAAAADLQDRLSHRAPTFMRPLLGVPWDVVPLVLGFFILVEGLSANGWVERLGGLLGRSARRVSPGGRATSAGRRHGASAAARRRSARPPLRLRSWRSSFQLQGSRLP